MDMDHFTELDPTEWAISTLSRFVRAVDRALRLEARLQWNSDLPTADEGEIFNEVDATGAVALEVLRRLDPTAADRLHATADGGSNYRSEQCKRVVLQAAEILQSRDEIDRRLGPAGPQLAAARLHADVWQAAAPLWSHGHRLDAVLAAARSVNALLQDRLGRRDVSETALVHEAWSEKPPSDRASRLRVAGADPEDRDSWKALHVGANQFGAGLFMRIRNVLAHGPPGGEIDEQEALEYLAAFSAFARWVDDAEVVTDDSEAH